MNGALATQERSLLWVKIAENVSFYPINEHFVQGIDHVFVGSITRRFDQDD
jgi:hypothetical protein